MKKLLIVLSILLLCGSAVAQYSPAPGQAEAVEVAAEWMRLLHETLGMAGASAPTAARTLAYMNVALHEAVALTSEDGQLLSGRLASLPELPLPDATLTYDPAAAAAGALAVVGAELLPQAAGSATDGMTMGETALRAAVNGLVTQQERNRLLLVSDREQVRRSLAYGREIGTAVLAWAAEDGIAELSGRMFVPSTGDPAYWTPSPTVGAVEPFWGLLSPLVVARADTCTTPLTMAFSINPASTFHKQAWELYSMDAAQTDGITFWQHTPGTTPTRWMVIIAQIVEQRDLSLTDAARLYAETSLAMHDALISGWLLKYETYLIRPDTYIRTYIDPNWQPRFTSPRSPGYPAEDALLAGAASEVLTAHLGVIAFTDNTGRVDGEAVERVFVSVEAAAFESAFAPMYGGVEYRAAAEAGMTQGECVGRQVLAALG
jgi:hypothetical protein